MIRSDGSYTRDYVYIGDAVSAYLAMAEQADRDEVKGAAFNFGPEKPHSVLDVVDVIRRLMDKESIEPVILNEVQAEIRHQYLSSEKARRVLGWHPAFTLEEGLRETIQWYTRFLDA